MSEYAISTEKWKASFRTLLVEMNWTSLAWLGSIGLVVLALFLCSCKGGAQTDNASSQSGTPPEQVVQSFYNWYLDHMESGPRDIRESEYIAPELIKKNLEASASEETGELVNFVCAQDFPDSVTVERAMITGNEAKVPVKTSGGNVLELTLKMVDGVWKINAVQCK